MKTILPLVVGLLLSVSFASADTCLKMESHTDGYYYGGRVNPPENAATEIWYGDSTMAYVAENRTIVIDLKTQSLLWINRNDSTYAETTLPVNWDNLATEETVEWLGRYPRDGVVTETDEVKEIDGRACRRYDVTSWISFDGSRFNETDEKRWVTTDLSIDWAVFEELNDVFLTIRNLDEEYAEGLMTIKGFPILSDGDRFIKGFSVKTTEEVVEILDENPPPGVYSIPDGFTKKEKLTIQDIRG